MPRRLLTVALAGAVALTGLTACRDEPNVAVYVGSAQFTNAQIDKIVDEFPADTRAAHAGQIRQIAVGEYVTREVADRIAADKDLTPQPVDLSAYEDQANSLKINPHGAFIGLIATADAALAAIKSVGKPEAPTDADQRAVYAQLISSGALTSDVPYAQIKDQLDSDDMRAALGLRTVIANGVTKYGVTVNPRYQPVGIPVQFTLNGGQVQTEIDVPLTPSATPAVVDLS